jgi:hypothetical protein
LQAAQDARESAIQRYAAAAKKSVPVTLLCILFQLMLLRTCRYSAIKAAAAAAKSAAQKKLDDAAEALKKKKAEDGVAAAAAAAAKKASDAAASARAAAAEKERMISTVASSKSNLPQVAAAAAPRVQRPARRSTASSIDTEVKYYTGHECSMAVIFPDDAEFASACARVKKERAARRSRAA